jgi:hypothetical protein
VRLTNPFCHSGSWLAVIDDTRTRIPGSAINHVLLSDLTNQYSCGWKLSAFSIMGATYIDADNAGDHVVYEIRHERARVVCSMKMFEFDE